MRLRNRARLLDRQYLGRKEWASFASQADVSDLTQFGDCLADTATRNVILADAKEARSIGAVATPAFVIGRGLYSGTVGDFETLVADELKNRRRLSGVRP